VSVFLTTVRTTRREAGAGGGQEASRVFCDKSERCKFIILNGLGEFLEKRILLNPMKSKFIYSFIGSVHILAEIFSGNSDPMKMKFIYHVHGVHT